MIVTDFMWNDHARTAKYKENTYEVFITFFSIALFSKN